MNQESFEFYSEPNSAEKEEAIDPLEQIYREILDVKAEIAQAKGNATEGPIGETRKLVPLYDKLHALQRRQLQLEKEQGAKKRFA